MPGGKLLTQEETKISIIHNSISKNMPVKTSKSPTKPNEEKQLLKVNYIPELNSQQSYNLVNALEHPQCSHVNRIFITEAGYFFSEGNDLYEYADLDSSNPREALLIKQGKKQKKVLMPGKYISRKRVLKEYTREEILESREDIIAAYKAEQKALKAKQKAEAGEEEGNAVDAITEVLQKLAETKK
jgi:hypothetical protein